MGGEKHNIQWGCRKTAKRSRSIHAHSVGRLVPNQACEKALRGGASWFPMPAMCLILVPKPSAGAIAGHQLLDKAPSNQRPLLLFFLLKKPLKQHGQRDWRTQSAVQEQMHQMVIMPNTAVPPVNAYHPNSATSSFQQHPLPRARARFGWRRRGRELALMQP